VIGLNEKNETVLNFFY